MRERGVGWGAMTVSGERGVGVGATALGRILFAVCPPTARRRKADGKERGR